MIKLPKYIACLSCFIFLMSSQSCSIRKDIIQPSQFYQSPYGSIVRGYCGKVNDSIPQSFKGELIAVDSASIIVKNTYDNKIHSYPKEKIKKLHVFLSTFVNELEPKHKVLYFVNGVLPLAHGWWMIITYPLNWTATGVPAFSAYKMRYPYEVTWNELYKFSRFPQGVPKQIELDQLIY